jgi:hypothetical protein
MANDSALPHGGGVGHSGQKGGRSKERKRDTGRTRYRDDAARYRDLKRLHDLHDFSLDFNQHAGALVMRAGTNGTPLASFGPIAREYVSHLSELNSKSTGFFSRQAMAGFREPDIPEERTAVLLEVRALLAILHNADEVARWDAHLSSRRKARRSKAERQPSTGS